MLMRRVWSIYLTLVVALVLAAPVAGQTSSIGVRHRVQEDAKKPEVKSRVHQEKPGNEVVERYSWIATKPKDPPTYKVNDLLTIIVREQSKYESEAELETEKQYDIKSDLDAFIKFTAGGVGATAFRRGKPTVDYKFKSKLEGEGDASRKDKLTTRITAKIVDVKPNGNLVIEAKRRVQHDDELYMIALTGICRKDDVTADNTILSTQLANTDITVKTEGALRDSTRRGWIPKLLDLLRPI